PYTTLFRSGVPAQAPFTVNDTRTVVARPLPSGPAGRLVYWTPVTSPFQIAISPAICATGGTAAARFGSVGMVPGVPATQGEMPELEQGSALGSVRLKDVR